MVGGEMAFTARRQSNTSFCALLSSFAEHSVHAQSIRKSQHNYTVLSSTNLRSRGGSFESVRQPSSITVSDARADDSKGPLGLNLLHSPNEPLADIIFVHGLGGGSRKTWSKTSSLTHYWPLEWLPRDPAFKDVRVHSFGYKSDFAKGEKDNCLDIHHFAKSLLGELGTSPYLTETKTPIVFVGHSMGGLVIKKAYLLANQDAFYDAIAKRIHTIFFLATPHRGADSAKLLKNILQITYSSRSYVSDLKRNSGAIQSINDGFRLYSANIGLWSFYETQKLSAGVFSVLVVDPSSATLGYREERQIPLNADHRSICKFEAPTDSNYITIRNALASIVHDIAKFASKSKEKLRRSQVRDLGNYLRVSDDIEDDLTIVEDARFPGTCGWISTRRSYLEWKDKANAPSVLWINGKPAAGKSVLAGYVVNQLRQERANCSVFFFKHGDRSKSRLSSCLRSLAVQMACADVQIREALLEMQKDDVKLDSDDERIIWRRLFLSGIFQTKFKNHFWIIDGLDECANMLSFFDTVLANRDEFLSLRILVTSRDSVELERRFSRFGTHRFRAEPMSSADSLPDIKAYVEANAQFLLVDDDHDRAVLVDRILEKSQGSFLWTALVLAELSDSYSEADISQVLADVPRGMGPLYQRSLDTMSRAGRGKKLAKAILTWAACATRPLTVKELENALKLDIKDSFPKLQESIVALCGHLVTVDKFARVQLVHETVREFLLDDDLESEFAINRREAHTRIARTCLTYITGEEMKPPRSSRRGTAIAPARRRAEFSAYAVAMFSYHLTKAEFLQNDLLMSTQKFLKSNVLSWIEIASHARDLNALVRTAKNLRIYANSCAKQRSPPSIELQIVRGWSTDLVRIAAKFGDALIASPSAIYSLILPFCPPLSMAYNSASPGRCISVMGTPNTQWDDRLSCMVFQRARTRAICYGNEFFGLALSTGKIILYHATSFQESKVLDHGESVQFLQFHDKMEVLVSCGESTIAVWNIHSGQVMYKFPAPQGAIDLTFINNVLIVASERNYLASWDLKKDGARLPDRPWKGVPSSGTPCAISISVGHEMLAVAHPMRQIVLWDLREDAYYGNCGNKLPSGETSTHPVTAMAFNPNSAIDLLAVSYLNGDLVLLDPFHDQVLEDRRADCHSLAASRDGRLLSAGAGFGEIHIYGFGTLALLYRVQSSGSFIKQLAFSNDNLHLADIRGSQCNIWEPAVLFRESIGDGSSEEASTSFTEAISTETRVKITAMSAHPDGEVVFCSKNDGSVCLYTLKTETEIQNLYHHKTVVLKLHWWPQSEALVSVDDANKILVWGIKKSPHEGWVAERPLFQSHLHSGDSISQILPGDARRFIVSTRISDHLWSIDGQEPQERTYSDESEIRKWIQHPRSSAHAVCFDRTTARIHTWADWSTVATVRVDIDLAGLQMKDVMLTSRSGTTQRILVELSASGPRKTRSLRLLDAKAFILEGKLEGKNTIADASTDLEKSTNLSPSVSEKTPGTATTNSTTRSLCTRKLRAISHRVSHLIGVSDAGQMVFLDTGSWVCSVDLEGPYGDSLSYARHFFVPYEWFSGTRQVVSALVGSDVLFARNDHVAIIRPGLDFVEEVTVDPHDESTAELKACTELARGLTL